jgi:hypothetical protein
VQLWEARPGADPGGEPLPWAPAGGLAQALHADSFLHAFALPGNASALLVSLDLDALLGTALAALQAAAQAEALGVRAGLWGGGGRGLGTAVHAVHAWQPERALRAGGRAWWKLSRQQRRFTPCSCIRCC